MTPRRVAGIAAITLGAIGLLCCLIGGGALWVGRAALDRQLDQLDGRVNGALDQADAALRTVGTVLDRMRAPVQRANAAATQLSITPGADRTAADRVLARLDQEIGAPYRDLRSRYGAIREQTITAIASVETLGQLLRFAPIPAIPTDALQEGDRRLQAIDETLIGMRAGLADRTMTVDRAARTLADATAQLDSQIGALATAISEITLRVAQFRVQLRAMLGAIRNGLLLGAIGLSLLLLWGAALHVSLLTHGRGWYQRR